MVTSGNAYLDFLKVFFLIVILIVGIVAGIIPITSKSFKESSKLKSIANAYGAGIFFTAGVLHLLHEADEKLDEWCGGHCSYPMASVITVGSYLAFFFLIKVVSPKKLQETSFEGLESEIEMDTITPEATKTEVCKYYNKCSAYCLMAALIVHSIIAGTALGIQGTPTTVLHVFLGVVSHKWAASLALGVFFTKTSLTLRKSLFLIVVFSVSTPVGVVFGMLIESQGNLLINGVVLAISAGTFFFISMSEVLEEEFKSQKDKYSKFLFLFMGSLTLALILLISHD
mmetsp:Transcript_7064/g.10413  ORF Transcript_7064/g.10413 Transcript_7064/m.10413 type:complete len:285 (-) Transcript_7064:1135-1989(-)